MLGVLLLFKISRNLIALKPFKNVVRTYIFLNRNRFSEEMFQCYFNVPWEFYANEIKHKLNMHKANPRANGAKRRSGRKPRARVPNFVLAEFKVVARSS